MTKSRKDTALGNKPKRDISDGLRGLGSPKMIDKRVERRYLGNADSMQLAARAKAPGGQGTLPLVPLPSKVGKCQFSSLTASQSKPPRVLAFGFAAWDASISLAAAGEWNIGKPNPSYASLRLGAEPMDDAPRVDVKQGLFCVRTARCLTPSNEKHRKNLWTERVRSLPSIGRMAGVYLE